MASHNQVIAIRPRSLAVVMDDLREARRDYDDAIGGFCPQCRGDGGWDDIRCDPRGADGTISQWVECQSCDNGRLSTRDAEDRATEAETRLEDLRDEFDTRLVEAAGLTVEQIMRAREEALI